MKSRSFPTLILFAILLAACGNEASQDHGDGEKHEHTGSEAAHEEGVEQDHGTTAAHSNDEGHSHDNDHEHAH